MSRRLDGYWILGCLRSLTRRHSGGGLVKRDAERSWGEEAMNGPTTTARRVEWKKKEKHGVDDPAQFRSDFVPRHLGRHKVVGSTGVRG